MKKRWTRITMIVAMVFFLVLNIPMTSYSVPANSYSGITVSTEYSGAIDVEMGDDGKLYVTEYSGGNILKIDPDGQNKAVFKSGLSQPIGMAFDGSGNLYVAEHNGHTVGKIDPDGNYTLIKDTGWGYLTGLVLDSSGKIFTVDYSSGKIYKMDSDGGNFTDFATGFASYSLIGLAIDENDNLYVSDRSNGKIIRIEPDGTVSDFYVGLSYPNWITLGEDGYFYISNGNRNIEKVNQNGNKVASFSTGSNTPWGSYVTKAGYIYFATLSSNLYEIVGSASTTDTLHISLLMNTTMEEGQADPAAFLLSGIDSNPQVVTAAVYGQSITLSLNSPITSLDTDIKVDYAKTGTNNLMILGSADELDNFTGLPVVNNIPRVISVESIPEITVANGTLQNAIGLPETVTINLSDSTTASAAVTWDSGIPAYSSNTAGTYVFSGALSLSDTISNPSNLEASVSVTVQEPGIPDVISVESILDITVANGTLQNAIGLPETVAITLSDSTTASAAVTWDSGTPTYSSNTAGTYVFSGALSLSDNVLNPSNLKASVSVTVQAAPSSGSSSGGRSSSAEKKTNATVTVNGQTQNAGTATTSTIGTQTLTTVTVDDEKIEEKIKTMSNKATVSIPITGSADIGEAVLNGKTIKDMEKKEAILEIKTDSTAYSLPASEIDIDSVSAQIGQAVDLKDIKINIQIVNPPEDIFRIVQDTADKNSYQIVVKPINFEITCTSGNKKVNVSRFKGYVERTIAIPDGVDPGKITTGIVLNEDGTFSHVPTTIVNINGKYYAKINSLTNSTYSVIYNPIEFPDVANHWAKDAVNEMGSRLVLTESGNSNYEPDRDITRAEFAAVIVRALGLAAGTGDNSFADVKTSDWYTGYVETAVSYDIISGYSDGTFGPNDKITREQAMTMIVRAMKLTGLYSTLTDAEISTQISNYTDGVSASEYAEESIAICLKNGLLSGKSSNSLAPKDYLTRAEAAVIIRRMLEKSGLI
ncbi:MAG: S-layer homology domain-containing protein [Clostridia bacterium]